MRRYLHYLSERLARTRRDFNAFAKEHIKSSVVALVVSAAGLAWLGPKGDDLSGQLSQILAYCIVGPVALTVLAFLLFWFLAPSRMFADHTRLISDLRPAEGMRFTYANRANDDTKVSLFRLNWQVFPSGQKVTQNLAMQVFYVGIENLTDKTLRNARVVIESVTKPERPTDIHCRFKRTMDKVIDVQPGAPELFLFGEGYDNRENSGGVMVRQASEVDVLLKQAKTVGFWLGSEVGGSFPLLRNDGYVVEFSAFADDVPKISAVAELNLKHRIELRLRPGPNVLDVE